MEEKQLLPTDTAAAELSAQHRQRRPHGAEGATHTVETMETEAHGAGAGLDCTARPPHAPVPWHQPRGSVPAPATITLV